MSLEKSFFLLPFLLLSYLYCNSQSFEGKIIYRVSAKTPDPERTSQETIDMMLMDMDTTAILYISKSRYKLVTLARDTGLPRIVNQYDPTFNMLYNYQPDSKFAMKSPNPAAITYQKKVIKRNGQKTLLDSNCAAISLTYSDTRTVIYYSNNFNVDTKDIRIDAPLFLQFMRQAEAIPLKIIMSGNGAIHALEYEATSIIREELPDSTFQLPDEG